MIIDAHAHYTSAPPELQAYRGRQVMNLRQPPRPRMQVSDEQLERSMRNQFKRMQDSGMTGCCFAPGLPGGSLAQAAAATGRKPATMIARIASFRTKSRGVSAPSRRGQPKSWVEELGDRDLSPAISAGCGGGFCALVGR
jgi:hypothetical protein